MDNLKRELKGLELKGAPLSCTLSYSLAELQSYPSDGDLLIKSSRAVAQIQYACLVDCDTLLEYPHSPRTGKI